MSCKMLSSKIRSLFPWRVTNESKFYYYICSGKTTLVKKICEALKKHEVTTYGFYTEELRVRGKRQGFDVVSLDGQRVPLARITETGSKHRGPMVGQYSVNKESFEQIAIPLLSTQVGGVGVIDEIGKMELFSKEFGDKVMQMFKENRVILATIPIQPLPFVNHIKSLYPSAMVIEVSQSNRDNLDVGLSKMLISACSS